MGFTRPTDRPAAGELLPHHFTLTCSSGTNFCAKKVEQAVCFCGTFLEVTLTGRYPAFCSTEFGLSSDQTDLRLPDFLKPA